MARAQASATVTTLHTFEGKRAGPTGLALGRNGDFYGTSFGVLPESGTPESPGMAFRVTPAGGATTFDVFDDGPAGSGQIQHPMGTLTLGSDGNFYGTSQSAFATVNGQGTVFQLTPAGTLTPLTNYVVVGNGGLVQTGDGSFYGTDQYGGAYGSGSVFKVTPSGQFTTLYAFADLSDGGVPTAPLVLGGDGNFYGTTSGTATESHEYNSVGTLFRITPAGALTTLATYAYNSEPIGLVAASDGNLYYLLGNTVYRMTLEGVTTAVYTFTGGSDGTSPGTLMQARDGNLYGTTASTVFRLTLAGALTTLYTFSGPSTFSGSDGLPNAALVQGADGNFYGTTESNTGHATVFMLTVPPAVVPAAPVVTSALSVSAPQGQAFTYQITASNSPTSFDTTSLPAGLGVDPGTGLISGTPTAAGTFAVTLDASNGGGTGTATLSLVVTPSGGYALPAFFSGETLVGNGVYYLAFPNGNYFGYYSFLADPAYIYHFDLGYEYVFDAADGQGGVYFYDFASGTFFYTSPVFPFPYLYDFSLNSVLYYYPDPSNPGRYNTDGMRYFYVFNTGQVISK